VKRCNNKNIIEDGDPVEEVRVSAKVLIVTKKK
jgi:hypothetical protein